MFAIANCLDAILRRFGFKLVLRRDAIDVTPAGAVWREYRPGPWRVCIRRKG